MINMLLGVFQPELNTGSDLVPKRKHMSDNKDQKRSYTDADADR